LFVRSALGQRWLPSLRPPSLAVPDWWFLTCGPCLAVRACRAQPASSSPCLTILDTLCVPRYNHSSLPGSRFDRTLSLSSWLPLCQNAWHCSRVGPVIWFRHLQREQYPDTASLSRTGHPCALAPQVPAIRCPLFVSAVAVSTTWPSSLSFSFWPAGADLELT
jgi:hypothetical protein